MPSIWIVVVTFLVICAMTSLHVAIGLVIKRKALFAKKPTNPIQDEIYWLEPKTKILLWPVLLSLWYNSMYLSLADNEGDEYVTYQDKMMKYIMDDYYRHVATCVDADCDHHPLWFPRPKYYRKYGLPPDENIRELT